MTIFKLFASCVPVKGYSISIICDLQRKTHFYVPDTLYEILTIHKDKSVSDIKQFYNHKHDEEIDQYFDYLLVNEFGFFCSDPSRFPDIDFVFETPELINNAIFDFNKTSNYNYIKAFNELDLLGCRFIELRFFDVVDNDKLIQILCSTNNKRFKNIDLYIKYCPSLDTEKLKKIFKSFGVVGKIIVHSSLFSKDFTSEYYYCLYYTQQQLKDESCCGNISMSNFTYDIRFYSEGQAYNTCLNKKISLDTNGMIKNCPSLKSHFGHIDKISFIEVIKDERFQTLWKINKDQIKVCQDCQFRYICSDCRAYLSETNAKPQKCKYDPYTNTWN